jgi:hypothetical protein
LEAFNRDGIEGVLPYFADEIEVYALTSLTAAIADGKGCSCCSTRC